MHFFSVFGFYQTELEGTERGEDYSIDIGFLKGALDQDLFVIVDVILGTASKCIPTCHVVIYVKLILCLA